MKTSDPTSCAQAVDEACRREFELAWMAGAPLPISKYVPRINGATLEELVHIDMEFAWKRWAKFNQGVGKDGAEDPSNPPLVEQYLAQFPSLDRAEIVLRLVRQEHHVRRLFADSPTIEEYQRRFPHLDLACLKLEGPESTHQNARGGAVVAIARPETASAAAAAPAMIPGVLADYRILREIGRGGMGVVYEAEQVSLHRRVALKVLPTPFSGSVEVARLRREAQAAAQFEHPHIIPIYEVGEHQGQPFFSMKLIEGGTLAERLAAGPLPGREAAHLLIPVCRAMAAAHRGGLVHRDLKPSNILLDPEAGPMIADFGLARFAEGPVLTASDSLVGTPSYMPPEQAGRHGSAMSSSGDIYSLGAILYHMLTGRPPFQGASAVETVLMVLEEDVLPPRLINSRVDPDLEAVALCCLQKQPARRYPTADALADDLEAFLDNRPVSAARAGVAGFLRRRLRRETRYAPALQSWGREWMFHGWFMLGMCLVLNLMLGLGVRSHGLILAFMLVCLPLWVVVFTKLRSRKEPENWIERLINCMGWNAAYVWLGVFLVEWIHGIPAFTFAPVLSVISSGLFLMLANLLSGRFYRWALVHLVGASIMVVLQVTPLPDFGLTMHGFFLWASYYVTGREYHRQAHDAAHGVPHPISVALHDEIPTIPATTLDFGQHSSQTQQPSGRD